MIRFYLQRSNEVAEHSFDVNEVIKDLILDQKSMANVLGIWSNSDKSNACAGVKCLEDYC